MSNSVKISNIIHSAGRIS